MALTKAQTEQITKTFEELFSDNQIATLLEQEDEPTYEYFVNDALEAQGFPVDANHYNTDVSMIISSGISYEDWTERYINDLNIETATDLQVANDENNVSAYILDNINSTNVDVLVDNELEEWIEEHGTEEYLEQRMEEYFDFLEFGELLEQEATDEVNAKLKESIAEDGFPEGTKPSDVTYLVDSNSIRLTIPFGDLAEIHIDDVEQYGKVQSYLDKQFYNDVLDTGRYDFDVEITSDVEDFE